MFNRATIAGLLIAATSVLPVGSLGQCPSRPGPETPASSIDVPSTSKITIKSIKFQGDTGLGPVEQAEIFEALKDKVDDEPKWIEDFEDRLADAWRERGYFKAQVRATADEITSTPADKVFHIRAHVESGRRYFLGEIRLLNGTQFSPDQLRDLFPIQAGDLFNNHKIGDGLNAVKRLYDSKGFINFSLVPDTEIDEAHGLVSVAVELYEGPQFRISAAYARGLDAESVKALLSGTGLEPGNTFNMETVAKFEKQHAALIAASLYEQKGFVCLDIGFPDLSQSDED